MLSSLFSVLLMAFLFEPLVAEAHQKKGCPSHCGNVKIQHPFGIGPNCSRNENFSITCNASSPSNPKPVLTKFHLEVLEIGRSDYLMGQITVNMPVARACGHNQAITASSPNMWDSPFWISKDKNVFASVGCDGFASLHTEKGEQIGGCTSTCDPANSGIGSTDGCNGYSCCHSEIAVHAWSSIWFTVSSVASCRSAFIINQDYLNHNATTTVAVAHSGVTPVVLQWFEGGTLEVGGGPGRAIRLLFGIVSGALLMSCSCLWSCWFCKTKEARKEAKLRAKYFKGRLEQSSLDREVVYKTKLFTIKELKEATNNFNVDWILGRGGQGTVYKGMLKNGQVVAVKRSKTFDESQWKQFINEVILLSQINHKHVVKLLGCCLETKLPLIVYEFIPNGTLSQHIHNPTSEFVLTWDMRVRIASEGANAISYLHSSSTTPVYHRDVKSSNILLDGKFQVKVSDFGISKAIPMSQTHLTTCVQGTFGYLDPEYFRSSQFSEKSDVYSFGVILVELLTGQHPIRMVTSEEERSLVVYFISAMNESTFDKILDPIVLEEGKKEEVMLLANIAKQCLNSRGAKRPTMKEVAMELEGLRKKISSTTAVGQISLDIDDVNSTPPTVIGNGCTTSAMHEIISISRENYGDKQA